MVRLTIFTAGVMLLAVTGLLVLVRRQPAVASPFILFQSDRSGERQIYRMFADGSDPRRLTPNRFVLPYTWSPDGRWITYSAGEMGEIDIYRMNALGGDVQRLTDSFGADMLPVWSPDAAWIVYQVNMLPRGVRSLYRMRPDGAEVMRLTPEYRNVSRMLWAGDWIIFSAFQERNWEIYRVRVDGKHLENLTKSLEDEYDPVLSEDGMWVFYNWYQGSTWGISQMRIDGSERINMVSNPPNRYIAAAWSWDRKWIAYVQITTGYNMDIFKMRPTCFCPDIFSGGTDVQNLTRNPALDENPVWSPPVNLRWRAWLNALAGVVLLGISLRFCVI